MAKQKTSKDRELDDSVAEEEPTNGAEGDESDEDTSVNDEPSDDEPSVDDEDEEAPDDQERVEEAEAEVEASSLGAQRYVHAAFFGVGILAAYLSGKLLLVGWNALADWPDAVRELPQLIQYGEEERATITLLGGAVVGVLLVLWYYRKESVRSWAGEVASELSKVTWPNKETVTSGTMVVLVASLVATVYVALLDRFWGYLTNLVYGA
jgi:preprotein translocase subunit SecE